jgi:hypothetical protein
MSSTWAARILCGIMGALIGSGITAHIAAIEVQARGAVVSASITGAQEETRRTVDMAQKVIAAWQSRAESCEAKFAVGTIVYQRQPLASFSIVHGLAAFDVNDPGSPKPSLYIPAQVDIYTNREDVRYAWIDGRTGAAKDGVHVALPPSSVK